MRKYVISLSLLIVMGFILSSASRSTIGADAKELPFSSGTVDFGIVVSDIEKSVDFYTNALGMKEAPGFSVPEGFCKEAGLTSGASLDIHVMKVGEDSGATKIKLMQVAGVQPKTQDNSYIHSTLGVSYLTVYVKDLKATLAQAKAKGVTPIASGPVALPKSTTVFLAIVKDPDGNLIELIGPMK